MSVNSLSAMQWLMLVGPTISALTAFGCLSLFLLDRTARYLLLLVGALILYTVSVFVHTLGAPAIPANAIMMFTNTCYAGSMMCLCAGVLQRSRRSVGRATLPAIFAVIVAATYYFIFLSPNLLARILIMNFGCAGILLLATLRARSLWQGRLSDRVLFILLLCFGLSFFVRTWLTTGGLADFVDSVTFNLSSYWIALQITLAFFAVALALTIMIVAMQDCIQKLNDERQRDPLTSLLNRRGFEERLAGYRGRRSRDKPTSLISGDLDRFKLINDRHGHKAGDQVLKAVGELLYSSVRAGDEVVRWGGEEFLVFMPDANATQATALAERLSQKIAALTYPGLPADVHITASFGVTQIEAGESFEALAARADSLMYEAKRKGRSRVVSDAGSDSVKNVAATATPPGTWAGGTP